MEIFGPVDIIARPIFTYHFGRFFGNDLTRKWFDLHRKNSDQPVYRYLYSKLRPELRDKNRASGLAGGTVEKSDDAPSPKPIGAPHAAEIEYAMGNLHLVDDYAWTADDYKASEAMRNYFANFLTKPTEIRGNRCQMPCFQSH